MDDSTEQGDCCPISHEDMETKGVSFGARQVRPDSFDAYVDKESARARARMLGCIGIRQYSSTTGGMVWMPCSNESDYRRVMGQSELGRRQRRRMMKAGFSDDQQTKALGSTIGAVGGQINTDPFSAIDADLDGLVLEGLPHINMGRGVPDPTPGGARRDSFAAQDGNFALAAMTRGKPTPTTERISEPKLFEVGERNVRPSQATRSRRNVEEAVRNFDNDGFEAMWRNATADLIDSELFDFDDADAAKNDFISAIEDVASRVSETVDSSFRAPDGRPDSSRRVADDTSARIAAKVLGSIAELTNNPPEIFAQNESVARRFASSMIESGAKRVAETGGKPGVWAFLIQALLGGAIGIQGGWELLARIFGIENGTGWIPHPTGRSLEILAPSLARQRSNESRSRAMGRVQKALDALRAAGFAIGEAREIPAVADDMAEALDGDGVIELPGDVVPTDSRTISSLDEMIRKMRSATGVTDSAPAPRRRRTQRQSETADAVTRNRMDLVGIPTGILDVFKTSSMEDLTEADAKASRLINAGGTDGTGKLNAELLYDVMKNQSSLRRFVAPVESAYAAQLGALIEEGRLPKLTDAILEMSPESVENFLAVNPRAIINSARSAKKKIRPSGSWISRIDHDPFEVAAHMLRAKDYHISAIANGYDTPKLTDAVDELLGNNASETAAIFASMVATNKDRLSEAYDGSVTVSRSGNKLLATARNLIANATENDSSWSASRTAISGVSDAMVAGDEPMAAMAKQVVRYGRNYPRHRRRSGDWSPIANKIRDSIQRYKGKYGAPAANSADLARFVDFSYPELLDEAAELVDLMKQKIEFGSLKFDDYASEGWKNRDVAELALDEFDPTNLESIFDPGKKMGLLKAIGVVLASAAKVAPSRNEQEGVLDLLDEVNSWSFTVLPLYSEPKSVTSRKRGIFPSVTQDAEAGMTVNRPVPMDVRETLAERQDPLGSGQRQGLPQMRMQRKLIERANAILSDSEPKDMVERLTVDPSGPVIDIAETFLTTAEQFRWDQETIASFYEDVAQMMHAMVRDVPDPDKRQKLADMFTDALEDISENMDDGNSEFFARVGDIPSRTVSRLARRIVSGNEVPTEAGMNRTDDGSEEEAQQLYEDEMSRRAEDFLTRNEFPELIEEDELQTGPTPQPQKRILSDAETTTIFDGVMRVVSSLQNENIRENPNDRDSWREKLRAAGINSPFSNAEILDDLADSLLPQDSLEPRPIFSNPYAGVSSDAIDDLDQILNSVLDELGVSTTGTVDDFVSDLRRIAGIRSSKDFHDTIRSLSARSGRATSDDFAEQVMENSYLTTSAIKARVSRMFPDFYEVMDSFVDEGDTEAGMSGPTLDRIRQSVVAAREVRELGKVAAMDDAKDYVMRTTEARRRRLASMAAPGEFLDFIIAGIRDQRSPLYLRRISAQRGGLEAYIKEASDLQINQIWEALSNFVSSARNELSEGGYGAFYSSMYLAAKTKALAEDPDFRPDATGNFTDQELLDRIGSSSWEAILPDSDAMTITPSDVDAVPSVRAKAEAALEVLSLDRNQLIALMTNESTTEEAQRNISEAIGAEAVRSDIQSKPGKVEYVPTPMHMEQISVADSITPLDSNSLVNFVETLDDAQLTSLEGIVPDVRVADAVEKETKTLSFATATRKLFGLVEIHSSEPNELRSLSKRVGQMLDDESFSSPVKDLLRAVMANDDLLASQILSEMNVADSANEASLLRAMWEFSRDSSGRSIASALPGNIDEAEKLAARRARAVGILKSQPDGGRGLARKTIDAHPKGGKGYDLVRISAEPTDRQKKILNLAQAIAEYDGSPESAAKIIYSLSEPQLENLRRNYIIPSILQRLDRQAYERRQEQSSIAQARARIDNLGRRLEMITFGSEEAERKVEDVVSRIDEALIKAFGDRSSELSMLSPQEREHYGDIVDYYVSGGSEVFDDPSEYARASRRERLAKAEPSENEFTSTASSQQQPTQPSVAEEENDFWDDLGIESGPIQDKGESTDAGMAGPTPTQGDGEKRELKPLPEEVAKKLFGDDVVGWIKEGTWTAGRTTFPTTDDPDEAAYVRRAISALFSVQEGKLPDDVSERLRKEGNYAASQLIFRALIGRTADLISAMPNPPYDFPGNGYDPRSDSDLDRRNFFLSAMQEYLSLHMTLGGDVLPIYDFSPDRDPTHYYFEIKRNDFQLQMSSDISNWRLVYNPDQPNDTVRSVNEEPPADEFTGDPSAHPDIQSVDRTISALKRQFPNFRDWLNQSTRYSRTLGGEHYEKDTAKFGVGIIDQVLADPTSMDLEKVIRQVAEQFPIRGYGDSVRLAQDAANLGADPDDVSPFPTMESYPNPDVMIGSDMPRDRIAKQKKIAVSSAKASAAARQSWWAMFSSGTTMDEYEIAAVSKTTDGDNFHPDAILSGLRKYARENGISDDQFDAMYSTAQAAANGRYNQVALQKVTAALNDIAMNSRGGVAGELMRLDQLMRTLRNQSKELSRHYQDRLRARIQTLYSAWGTMTASFDAERERLGRELSAGRMTPQEVVDEIRRLWLSMQPAAYSALNQIADLSRRTRASQRARDAVDTQIGEIEQRIEEIRNAVNLTVTDMDARMRILRGVNNGLSHLANDPNALNDDNDAGMSVGKTKFGIVGQTPDRVGQKRELLSSKEKLFAEELRKINDLVSATNLEDMSFVPDLRTAMATLRGGIPDRVIPQMRFGTDSEIRQAKKIAARMIRADMDAESATRKIMGSRFTRFSEMALNSLPGLTRRIAEDVIVDGFAVAMSANNAKEQDVEAALLMLNDATKNARNFAIYNPLEITARYFNVDPEEVADAIATETLLAKTSNVLRSAQTYASGLSATYSERSVRRMTANRFPELENLGSVYLDSIFVNDDAVGEANAKLESAILLNSMIGLGPSTISSAFGVSEDVAQLISAAGRDKSPLPDLRQPLPHDWNFMTFRDRQLWLGSEEAFNSLGRMGVNDELAKLQREIEDFGSMDGPYPALARVISGNDTSMGTFGRQLIGRDGMSPLYASRGLSQADLVNGGTYQFASLVEAVPGIEQMSDRAMSRFLNAPYDVISNLRKEGMAMAPESAETIARAFGKSRADIWPSEIPSPDTDPGNFYWLASTWDRSGQALSAINDGADMDQVASEIDNGIFVVDKVSQLVNDGTVDRFFDAVGIEEITAEDAANYIANSAPRSRKGVVELMASAGYREQDIVDATGFNANTVRNSLHELRKQGLLPDVVGSPRWIAQNSPAVLSDFSSGVSKRSLMRKYGIGSRTLESILASEPNKLTMNDAYGEEAMAGMANRRLPEESKLSDGPSEDWRESRLTRADGSTIDPNVQSPPAVVGDPFIQGRPSSLGVDGYVKDPKKMELWAQAVSSWISLVLEGGYFRNKSDSISKEEKLLMGIFGDVGSELPEQAVFELIPNEPAGNVTGKSYQLFDIATRQENPAQEIFGYHAIPSVIRDEFANTGVYRGIMPMLRTMLLATYDKAFKQFGDQNDDSLASFSEITNGELIEAGLLDEAELPRGLGDEMRLKLWQLRQMLRNPNMVDAPPMFEEGDEKVMRLLIPMMAATDEKNLMRMRYGTTPTDTLSDPSQAITGSTQMGNEVWNRDEDPWLKGVPMFSNLLIGSVVQGNAEAKKIVDQLTPRQIMLANWVYGIYTAVDPIVESFGEMMPTQIVRTASPNIPEEPGSRAMLGDRMYVPVREVDDQVFAFAFDSVFKALQDAAEQPGLILMESLPTEAWSSLYAPSGEANKAKAESMMKSTKVLSRIVADVLATSLYRKAVQSLARPDMDENRTPFFTGTQGGTDWFRFARPRVDSYGYWSMYGPNIVYAGPNGNPYNPGWNDETNAISELGGIASMSDDDWSYEQETMQALQKIVDETPGKYWWETEAAQGELSDEQIIAMHPEEFADYVSSLSMFQEGELSENNNAQLLNRVVGRVSAMGYPTPELERFDEWIGPIIKGLPEGTVTKEAVLAQLKNIFPWLDTNRMDDIYPVTGKTLAEAMSELRKSLSEMSENQVTRLYSLRPQLRIATSIVNDRNHPFREWRDQFLLPLIQGLMQLHRTNIEVGYRQVAAFSAGLERMLAPQEINYFQKEIAAITQLLGSMHEDGRINLETFGKLMSEIVRVAGASLFGDLEFGDEVMNAIVEGSQDDISTFMGIIAQNTSALEEGGDAPALNQSQQEFVERYVGHFLDMQDKLGTAFEQHIRSGYYGSVKTIGEAVREMEPFILATERTKRRRMLLPRYKREVIDPMRDSLLTDSEKMKTIPTFNDWLDANGFQDLTYDKNGDGDQTDAGMSSVTRAAIARFTDDAASAVVEGYEDSARNGSPEFNLAHLLSGAWRSLMTDVNNPGAYSVALRRLGITSDRVTEALSSLMKPSDSPSDRPTGFSKAAQRAMVGAIKAASRRGDEFVDLGDVLQSIFSDDLRGSSDDGISQALNAANISPNVIRMVIASARITGGGAPEPSAEAGMSKSRRRINSIDKSDDLKRNKILANEHWFNQGRSYGIATGTASDSELVGEVERLMNLYSAAANMNDLSPYDFRGGQSPFAPNAVRMTNSYLVHGENGQEPSDLVGAIRHAMDRAEALVTNDGEQSRLNKLKSVMRLYFDNDEHLPSEDSAQPEAGMTREFSEMMQPITDNFARSEQIDQKLYYEGIYGDADLSENELRRAADITSLGSPFDISKNLDGNEDDINWSTSEWSFGKDDRFVEAADSVMIRMRNEDISTAEIAMISRKSGPFRDAMALVGGLRDGQEDLMTTATRETMEEVGVSLENTYQAQYMGTIEAPDWDPRFVNGARVGAGMFVLPWDTQLSAASDASGARWVPLSEIASGTHRLAFGHAEWIRKAVAAMRIDPSSDPYGDIRLSITKRLGLLSKASRVRNQKMIAAVNSVRRATGKKLFPESGNMPHPMMPWGNRVARSSWRFRGDEVAEAGMSGPQRNEIDDSLPRDLGLLSVQSKMSPRILEQGSDTSGFYKVGHSRGGEDLFSAWGDKDRVEQLWKPYVEASLERARRGDVPNDQQRPVVYILGGASGVGKSAARNTGLAGIPNYDSAVVADPDDAKIMMPEARLWYSRRMPGASSLVHQESRQATAVLARAATREGLDLVYDTSGQFNDGFEDIKDWKKKGYDMVAHYFFAPEETLLRRVKEREERTGRGVPSNIVTTIQWNVMQMLPNFIGRQLFDELYIWDTEKDPAKPLLVGQLLLGQPGQPQMLQIKHPYLFRYLLKDRVGPDGATLEPRKTQSITIPYSGR